MPESSNAAIAAVVSELRTAVATLTGAVKALEATALRLETNSVTREAHEALKDDVSDLREEARTGIARNDDRWSRVAWFIGLTLLGAVLTLLLSKQGGW